MILNCGIYVWAESFCGYVLEIIGGWLTLSSVKELQNMGILSIGWMAFQEAAVRARRRDNNLVLIYFLEIPPYGDHLAHGSSRKGDQANLRR